MLSSYILHNLQNDESLDYAEQIMSFIFDPELSYNSVVNRADVFPGVKDSNPVAVVMKLALFGSCDNPNEYNAAFSNSQLYMDIAKNHSSLSESSYTMSNTKYTYNNLWVNIKSNTGKN